MIVENVRGLVGATPLMRLSRFAAEYCPQAQLLAKVEFLNPSGSVKDRAAKAMIEDAEARGVLKAGGVIVEPTSGNTGIGLACIAAASGYRVILTMPETMSEERRRLLRAYGAEIVLTPGSEGMAGAVARAEEIVRQTPGSFLAGQFENPVNPAAHYRTTGPEIWQDAAGRVDCFVAGVGTGGTLSGVGRYLKEKNPAVRVVAAEPASSPLLSQGRSGAHGIQGIGANFVPKTLDTSVMDEVIAVTDEAAFSMARALVRHEGLFAGISAGAALAAAVTWASRQENAGKSVVVLLPDSGDRYLSTPLAEV